MLLYMFLISNLSINIVSSTLKTNIKYHTIYSIHWYHYIDEFNDKITVFILFIYSKTLYYGIFTRYFLIPYININLYNGAGELA